MRELVDVDDRVNACHMTHKNPAYPSLTFLFLENGPLCRNLPLLRQRQIAYVINCTPEVASGGVPNYHHPRQALSARGPGRASPLGDCVAPGAFRPLEYHRLDMVDNGTERLARHFERFWELMERVRIRESGNVLVHCNQGVSRSVAMVASYLIRFFKMSVEDAVALIQVNRPVAKPNDAFMRQLRELHADLKASGAYPENAVEFSLADARHDPDALLEHERRLASSRRAFAAAANAQAVAAASRRVVGPARPHTGPESVRVETAGRSEGGGGEEGVCASSLKDPDRRGEDDSRSSGEAEKNEGETRGRSEGVVIGPQFPAPGERVGENDFTGDDKESSKVRKTEQIESVRREQEGGRCISFEKEDFVSPAGPWEREEKRPGVEEDRLLSDEGDTAPGGEKKRSRFRLSGTLSATAREGQAAQDKNDGERRTGENDLDRVTSDVEVDRRGVDQTEEHLEAEQEKAARREDEVLDTRKGESREERNFQVNGEDSTRSRSRSPSVVVFSRSPSCSVSVDDRPRLKSPWVPPPLFGALPKKRCTESEPRPSTASASAASSSRCFRSAERLCACSSPGKKSLFSAPAANSKPEPEAPAATCASPLLQVGHKREREGACFPDSDGRRSLDLASAALASTDGTRRRASSDSSRESDADEVAFVKERRRPTRGRDGLVRRPSSRSVSADSEGEARGDAHCRSSGGAAGSSRCLGADGARTRRTSSSPSPERVRRREANSPVARWRDSREVANHRERGRRSRSSSGPRGEAESSRGAADAWGRRRGSKRGNDKDRREWRTCRRVSCSDSEDGVKRQNGWTLARESLARRRAERESQQSSSRETSISSERETKQWNKDTERESEQCRRGEAVFRRCSRGEGVRVSGSEEGSGRSSHSKSPERDERNSFSRSPERDGRGSYSRSPERGRKDSHGRSRDRSRGDSHSGSRERSKTDVYFRSSSSSMLPERKRRATAEGRHCAATRRPVWRREKV
ncbi:dual specificity phosphatase, catalytic domain-containing protein [Toxoplasma gondii RUB]|uniref:protein-tyrosine-phosphatase n=1 Tax=Toxoplasma gondii RUB TaxID=935652 RepID=A0A086LWR2_TOXGO|nr:dual specificity phosphatase, catalytic domain-containing protein [Toxoplasma gondii RUB]